MAGHSKWANIKHRKGAQDKKRGKIFQKIARQLSIAVKQGGNNINTNNTLRLIIEKAKAVNMPKDNIERALKRFEKEELVNYEDVVYEGYFAGQIAVMVTALTDNKKRTFSHIRNYFTKNNAILGVNGSVSYLFDKVGLLVFKHFNFTESQVLEWAIAYEFLNFEANDNLFMIETSPDQFWQTKKFLEEQGINEFEISEVTYQPNQEVALDDEVLKEEFSNLIEMLEDDDDVQNIYHNMIQ